jgi:flagellar biosynthesis/type III secretory pathway protein FliH
LQRLAPAVEAAIRAVIGANVARDAEAVHARIREVLTTAVQHNYV